METTTIRVDRDTHSRLLELSEANGDTLTKTVRDAAEALQRIRFGLLVQEELAVLKGDPTAWNNYLAQAETSSVADGVS